MEKFDFALSVGEKRLIEKNGFEEMKNAGIKAIELSFGDYTDFDYKAVKNLSRDFGIDIWSLHLPFMPFEDIDISFTDTKKREKTVKMLSDIIEKASDVGIDKFVIHASGEPVLPGDRSERLKCGMDSLFVLSEFAKGTNSVIAVENLPRTCLGNRSDEINLLTSVNDNLKVCFDTNHLFGENHSEFVKNLKKDIITVHISDYDFVGERHWLPKVGKVDWQEVIGLLNGVGYNGPWLYEVSFLQRTNDGEKHLSLSDFAENYRELKLK